MIYRVQVRELIEFALRSGDLGGERDFVGSGRALAGIRGHQKVQRSRPADYQKEVPVSLELEQDEFVLRIQGRVDGVLPARESLLVEEIKTVMPGWSGTPDPLHWAQLKAYAFILARESSLPVITLRLTYLELETGHLSEHLQEATRDELQSFFESATVIYLEWLGDWHNWCRVRNDSIRSLQFPFAQYRPGQRRLAVAAYRALANGKRLFAEAPTGIGKTVSVVFPALKALGEGKLERIFYLTARTTGRVIAEKCFADLTAAGLRARTLTLTAKEKICPRQGQPCDPATCPLALGYYDRVKGAMRSALKHETLTRAVVESMAAEHQVCPFELSLDLSTWVDAVICDYNYVFDPKVYLKRHFAEEPTNYGFLIDEAHNLVDRAREIFSATLSRAEVRDVHQLIKTALPRCGRALNKVSKAMRGLARAAADQPEEPDPGASEPELFGDVTTEGKAGPSSAPPQGTVYAVGGEKTLVFKSAPDALNEAVDGALKEAEAWLSRNDETEFRESLLQLYFNLFAFRRTAEMYDERYVTVLETGNGLIVKLFCVDPSVLLNKALERGKGAVFFSATLTPVDYYRRLLGGVENTDSLRLVSPFPPEHLAVMVERRIRTTFKAREASLRDVADAIRALTGQRRGNYLVYFPSYTYMAAVLGLFENSVPGVRLVAQRPGMTDAEREEFLADFKTQDHETLVGFAVMGGIFGEGIDLVGDRLIGTVIVGVGLPQLCAEREIIRSHFASRDGTGFEYAYLFPGLNRVLQASGRVIRSETDRGAVLLIDARFDERRYRELLPPWWQIRPVRSAAEIALRATEFWELNNGPIKPLTGMK